VVTATCHVHLPFCTYFIVECSNLSSNADCGLQFVQGARSMMKPLCTSDC
jgi:hypothetical protein